MVAAQARQASVAYSGPPFGAEECRDLRRANVRLVRLKERDETSDVLGGTLTLDATMPVEPVVATICAVLKL
jgi:hypothetical protein